MNSLSRRTFIKGAAGVALIVGFSAEGTLAQHTPNAVALTPFVKITGDGSVIAVIKHFEGGQGTATGLSALVAEELNMRLQDIDFETAPADDSRYANLFIRVQLTGGSTSMANSYMQYRMAAAAAGEMLVQAAANEWGVQTSEVTLSNGRLTAPDRSASIGDFVQAASALDAPEAPSLKPRSEWTVIGVEQRARLDTDAKIDGSALYSMDIQLDGQMVVAINRSPSLGAKAVAFDDTAAKAVPGFLMAHIMPDGDGVAAFAETTWAAFQARDALDVEWDLSGAETRSSPELKEELMGMIKSSPEHQVTDTDLASAEAALATADQVIETEFYVPILAHGPMETLGATLEPTEAGGVIVHDGAQYPSAGRRVTSEVLEIPLEDVAVNTLYAGGFFGRRGSTDVDYVKELAQAFSLTDRNRPLKLQWSREDDIRGGYYRPAYAHRVRVGLDSRGQIAAWDHRVAGQSVFKGTVLEGLLVQDGIDRGSVLGLFDTVYSLGTHHLGLTDQGGPTTAIWWRSPGHNHTAFAEECVMDLCAAQVGVDPVEFRLRHLDESDPDKSRMAATIRLAAEKSGWGEPLPEGRFRGFAAHKSHRSYVAQVCEISVDAENRVKIERFTAAVDCGIAVTPDVVRAQIQSGIGYGIGHAMRCEITLENGVPQQSNFFDFETLRMTDLSHIDVHIVPSDANPTGVGEPGTPPAAPALANAIAAAGLGLVTQLPMTGSGISFV